MKKKNNSNGSYGIYIKKDESTYELCKGGFKNTNECQRWIKKNIDEIALDGNDEVLAILSKRKEVNPEVKVRKTVYLHNVNKEDGGRDDG